MPTTASVPNKEHLMVPGLLKQGHTSAVRLKQGAGKKTRTLVSSNDACP